MKRIISLFIFCLLLGVGAASVAHGQQFHPVAAGDTLWKLAEQHQTTVLELLELNPGITPDNLRIGEDILLPKAPLWSYHVVQPQDNLRSLAIQYRVPLDALRQANGLKQGEPRVGEMIRIPIHLYQAEAQKRTHTVEIGDTLYLLAQKYKVSLQELKQWNELEDLNLIIAGQILIVG